MENRDPAEEERNVLKDAGVVDDAVLELMDVYIGDRVRWKFYYGEEGFEEFEGHFLGFYTLFEGPEGGGDVNIVIRTRRGDRDVVLYKDRHYLVEFEVVEPNKEARERFQKIHDQYGRRVGREFG